ncbi:unnamed protein product [Candida verbasci]|uniref:Morphogenetic regulator of filamentous growth protein 1 n=1 Tax=Candida verbasci TaxID=1227364 RepID=A0A9W4TTJ8_9ASCO|nr:unnamed protein product [Candida verbasci]
MNNNNQPQPPPPQQMFNQTPQMPYQQQPGGRNTNQQQQIHQQNLVHQQQSNQQQQPQFNVNNMSNFPPLMNQQQMLNAQQQLQQQQSLENPAITTNMRPGLQRNSNFSASPNSSQPNSANLQYNPNSMMQGLNSANIPTGLNSQTQTPSMPNQPQPFMRTNVQPQQPQQKKIVNGANIPNLQPNNTTQAFDSPQQAFQNQPKSTMTPIQKETIPATVTNPQQQQQQQQDINSRNVNIENEQLQHELNTRIIKRNLGNAAAMRILDLVDYVSNERYESLSQLSFWQRVVSAYFLPNAVIKFNTINSKNFPKKYNNTTLHDATGLNFDFLNLNKINNSNISHQFELNSITAPRFFVSCIKSEKIVSFHVNLENLKFQVFNNGSIIVVSKFTFNYEYQDGSIAIVKGTSKFLMSRDLRIEFADLNCIDYQTSIGFDALENMFNDWKSKDLKKQNPFSEANRNFDAVNACTTFGIDAKALRVLQVGDIMSSLKSLMEYSVMTNTLSPKKAIEAMVNSPNNHQQMAAAAAFQAQMVAAVNNHGQFQQQQQQQQPNNSQQPQTSSK